MEQAQSGSLDPQRLARLEAILTGVPGDRELRLVLEQLDPGHAGTFTWLDQRNASIALVPGTAAVPVQVLLELRGRGALGVLVTSREGMSRGAPLSRGVLEQILRRIRDPGCRSVDCYGSWLGDWFSATGGRMLGYQHRTHAATALGTWHQGCREAHRCLGA